VGVRFEPASTEEEDREFDRDREQQRDLHG
jgi:hypothetical protein